MTRSARLIAAETAAKRHSRAAATARVCHAALRPQRETAVRPAIARVWKQHVRAGVGACSGDGAVGPVWTPEPAGTGNHDSLAAQLAQELRAAGGSAW